MPTTADVASPRVTLISDITPHIEISMVSIIIGNKSKQKFITNSPIRAIRFTQMENWKMIG